MHDHFLRSPGFRNLAPTQNHFLQGPSLQDLAATENQLLPSPGSQNLAATQTFRTDHLDYPMNQHYYSIWSVDSRGVNTSPGHDNVFQGQSHNGLSRLNHETPPCDQYNMSSPFQNQVAPSCDLYNMSSPFQNQVDMDEQIRRLQRLTMDYPDQVRQQTVVYPRANNVPFTINHHSDYRTSFATQQYGNIQNGAPNLAAAAAAAATNQRAANISNSLLRDEFSLGYSSARRDSWARAIGLDFGSQYNGERSTNGFHQHQLLNSNVHSSYLYNNNVVGRARQRATRVEELRGRLCLVAKDQLRSRFLQEKIDERNPEIIEMIFMEVKNEWYQLMVHQFGNHLIQKLLEALNEEQMTQFLIWVAGSEQRLFKLCEDVHGTRVMQQVIDLGETLNPNQTSILVSALKNITVKLSKSSNGYRVIHRCFQKLSNEYTKDLVEEIAENCLNLATDKSGCCVLPQCIMHAKEEHKGRLTADIVTNALLLAEHPFGNYVLQGVLEMKIPQVTADIVSQLKGNYFTLSQGICSSNVVEKCMKESGLEQCTAIINEIVHHPDVLQLMLHPYGNFVIQSAWKLSEGRPILQQAIYCLVQMNLSTLQTNIFGRKVLKRVRGKRLRY